ncbi:MAG TPA: sugar ABC transporter ATP-binding protein [Actinocrinis sp.]|uniref:sugar ABC transporter ATP-binding protein n=1 Tax=Actinocrinis sp. TaxID=1920516 RepID=UPI002DDD71F9|nr:sugar ABC transporter ATP-binding protein [Actinocrinis sp.]HEV2345787.1 sugar ABC transporter ATP-binding protein [Actinocrinis sp.]
MTAVEAVGVHKSFGPTRALRGIDLALEPGRCLGLVGRNGAGKSTLVSILSGLLQADAGEVRFGGEPAPPAGAVHAWRERIATVHQHSMVVPDLTVAENVFLGRLPGRGGVPGWRPVSWRTVKAEARRTLADWGLDIDAGAPCRGLTIEQRQLVEIARAVASGTRCLLLDEPTAALEHDAVARLFDRVRQLTASGVAVLYISHHLEEVFEICDDVAVLRDGDLVLSSPAAELSRERLVAAMVGPVPTREIDERLSRLDLSGAGAQQAAERLLEVQDLTAGSAHGGLRGVSLRVAAGEQVGVVGLVSSGVITLGRIVAGADRADDGTVTLAGRRLPNGKRDAALRAGVGYIPEDRRTEGFVGPLSIAENVTMTVTDRLARAGRGVLVPRALERAAAPLAGALSVAAASLKQPVAELSGGNQQKVTVARALIRDPKLVVAITPTRGVDVASKELLLGALRAAAERGAGVLLATDDLDDIEHCDRVVVLVRGRVVAQFHRSQRDGRPFDREALIAATEGLGVDAAGAEGSSVGGSSADGSSADGSSVDESDASGSDDADSDTAGHMQEADRKDGLG